MIKARAIFDVLAERLIDSETSWSLGTFGAIAEFMRGVGEPTELSCASQCLSAVTDRGGIRIEPLAGLRLIASQTPVGEGWNHRVALCLREDRCTMNRRSVLTELGTDAFALRSKDRDGTFFDLGLGCLQVDACVRTADPILIAQLRSHAGRSLFEHGNGAMASIVAASPHRVFISRVGRIEVFQTIPPADGTSPVGPHTHVLPKLLSHGRTHAATEPIPTGWIPCAHVYPPHPAKDAYGRARKFTPAHNDAFERLLDTFGDAELVSLKRRVAMAVTDGEDPSTIAPSQNRYARASIRVALRQLKASGARLPKLMAWMTVHDMSVADDAAVSSCDHESL